MKEFGDDVSRIIVSIESGNNTVDKLAEVLDLAAVEVMMRLSMLEVEGLVALDGEKVRLLKN